MNKQATFHDVTYDQLEKLIGSISDKMCTRWNLAYHHREDMTQEAWIAVMKASKSYEDLGYSFITYAYNAITWACRRYAQQVTRASGRFITTDEIPESLIDTQSTDNIEALIHEIEDGDLLMLATDGYMIGEIKKMVEPGREVSLAKIEVARQRFREKLTT